MPVYRSFQYRQNLYRGGGTAGTAFSTDLIVFDSFSLSDGTTMICQDLIESAPTREIISGNVPRGNGQYVNGDYWREKTIECRGIIKAASAALLNTQLDTVRMNLRKREANLDITRDGAARRYVATLVNGEELFAGRRGYDITLCPFNARFVCKTPFAKARTYTSELEQFSVSPTTHVIANTGTIIADPVVILLFDAANTVTVVNMNNTTTSEQIEYTGTVAAGDWIMFDTENKKVQKNGTDVNYTGSFPTLDVGSNSIVFTITATSFTCSATIKYKIPYL